MNDSGPPAGMQNLDKPQRRDILYRYIYGLVSCLSSLHRGYDGTFTSHHDLKPENILVIEEELKIADFGQSHLRSLTQGSETEAPHVGTYEYQPPEYWKNDGSRSILKHGRAFDIWSMGCICIELATLIVYGWESSMITEFRNQRRRNPTKNNPILAFKRAPDDSFHNNRDAVTRWINQLQLVDASEKLKSTLNVVRQMIAETPQERLYAWEAELDLYNIQRPDDDRVRRLEKGTHCIQGPQRKIFRNGIRTPLHRAAQNGDPDRIIQLFEAGWSLYVQDHEGKTALNVYEETQHRDLYKNLCERLVSKPSEEEIDERIILAAREGRVNEILDLLKQRISPMSTDEHGHSALFKAVEHGQASVIDCLLQAELANSKELVRQKENQWQDTPLHRAAFKGRPDIMKQVLKFLPDIEDQQKEGKTALFVAADWDHPEVAQLLLDKGAQLFTLNKSKETPLHEAARSGRIKVLQMLLNADDLGKCLEHRSSWGETPLWLAVHHNHPHLAQILIEKGASVHVTNFDGISLLERVVKLNLLGFWDTNSQLFARRDVENRNRSGRTPLDIAQDEKRLTFVPILKDLLLKN